MAYIFELEEAFEEKPFQDNQGTYILEFVLGYDLDSNSADVMSIMLVHGESHLDGKVPGVYDLMFGIRERDLDHTWRVSAPDFTLERSRECIPDPERPRVKDCLGRAIITLVRVAGPEHVTFQTYYENVPENGLKKYKYIVDLLASIGYQLQSAFQGDDLRHYWHLSKVG